MVNKVILIGNLGSDPEIKNFEGDVSVARFSVATSESYFDKNSNEKKTLTEWHYVVAWRQLAKLAEQYLHKGSQVYIEGKLTTRKWTDQNGQDRYSTEIVAKEFRMLGKKEDGASFRSYQPPMESLESSLETKFPTQESSSAYPENHKMPLDDDLPF